MRLGHFYITNFPLYETTRFSNGDIFDQKKKLKHGHKGGRAITPLRHLGAAAEPPSLFC
jgi:hypothetical protein